MPQGGENSFRVLIFAPVGKDSQLLAQAADLQGIAVKITTSAAEFALAFREGCGVALLTEEALFEDRNGALRSAVDEQPTWSEVPFVLLASRGQPDQRVRLALELMHPLRNVTVLERPVRPATIVLALEATLRDRKRQYEVRDAIEALRVANLELEQRVEERTSDLVAKIGELEGFCYSVSHDMRTPLRAIVGNAAMVLESEYDDISNAGRQKLKQLSAAALKMARLIDDLLQYARLGNLDVRREQVDFTELAKQVAEECLSEHHLDPSVVEVSEGLTTLGDPRLIGLMLHNLIDNALKYRSPSQHPRIEIGRISGDVYFVSDNGIGFDMQYRDKLFKPFERLHRDSEFPGTGIGLANVKRIVERHDGQIWAESEGYGLGATFFFTLDSAQLSDAGPAQVNPTQVSIE